MSSTIAGLFFFFLYSRTLVEWNNRIISSEQVLIEKYCYIWPEKYNSAHNSYKTFGGWFIYDRMAAQTKNNYT